MLQFLFSAVGSLITNPFIIIVGWFAGASFKDIPIAMLIGAIGAALAQLLALPLVRVFQAMEGPMAADRWPGNIEFITAGSVGGMIVTTAIWLYVNSNVSDSSVTSDSPSTQSSNDHEKQ